ncbi:HPr kinase/phosphorylase [Sphingomonas bacterium]|uniref:HPr kinase/phosphorylase n=1 Tax=Sphingomonas bacterium TaxID=1895847 RepID=UPI0015754115|nr:aldolase [Sphingomonas bacterium]
MSDDPVHATTVAIRGRGVLIEGPSGAGKSDLALRLIDRGAVLVSDDYTALAPRGGTLYALAPATIAGKLEVRGVGIVEMTDAGPVPVALAVRLGEPERMPRAATLLLAGVAVPVVTLRPFEASTPIKVELALARLA